MKKVFILSIVFSVFLSCGQKVNTWPQFRGDNCTGIAGMKEKPPISLSKEDNLLWECELETGYSSPIIWKNNIFLTGYSEENKVLKLYSINRRNGKLSWRKDIEIEEPGKRNAANNPSFATAATDGQRVVFYLDCYGLLCYNFEGEQIWDLKFPNPKNRHGMGTSPVICQENVILNLFGDVNKPRLLAIDKTNGEILWEYISEQDTADLFADSYSTPVIHENKVIVYRSKNVSAYNIEDGSIAWSIESNGFDAVCTPVIGENKLYYTVFSTLGNPDFLSQFPEYKALISQYDSNNDKTLSKEELKEYTTYNYPEKMDVVKPYPMSVVLGWWDQNNDDYLDSTEYQSTLKWFESFFNNQGIRAINLDQSGELDITNIAWSHTDHVPQVSSPIYYKGLIYMVKSGGILSCLDADNGTLYYRERVGATGTYFASPVVANDMIYLVSRNGIVTVIKAGKKLEIISQNDLDEKICASPAILDNKIYIRTNENLYAFGQ